MSRNPSSLHTQNVQTPGVGKVTMPLAVNTKLSAPSVTDEWAGKGDTGENVFCGELSAKHTVAYLPVTTFDQNDGADKYFSARSRFETGDFIL